MATKDSALMGFHGIDNNKVHTSKFDLGRRNLFTAKIGELYPVFCEEVLPGDEFNVNMQHFSRSMPVQTAAFTRLRENIQFFFVPYTSLYYRFRECMQNMEKGQNGQNVSRSASSPLLDKQLSSELPFMTVGSIYTYFSALLHAMEEIEKSPSVDNPTLNAEYVCRISDTAKLLMSLGYGNYTEFSKISQDSETGKFQLNGADIDYETLYAKLDAAKRYELALSPFRLLAYHRIWNDHYRYMQWQPWRSFSCNVDYINGTMDTDIFTHGDVSSLINVQRNIFDMEYSNLPLDLFNGAIPNQQFGDESVVNLSTSSSDIDVVTGVSKTDSTVTPILSGQRVSISETTNGLTFSADGEQAANGTSVVTDGLYRLKKGVDGNPINYVAGFINDLGADVPVNLVTDVQTTSQKVTVGDTAALSIIALRKATALQRYKEIQNCHDADFVEQVRAHFGVKLSDNGEKSVFLGGYSSVFDINPQVNQNLADGNVANIQAAPTANGNGSFHFKSGKDGYGVIIGIYRITPQLDYANVGLEPRLLLTSAGDYPIPELDSIGMEEHNFGQIFVGDVGSATYDPDDRADVLCYKSIGYAPRYCAWKLSHDGFNGAFLSTLKTWVSGQSLEDLALLASDSNTFGFDSTTPELFKCPPSMAKDIFVNQNFSGGIDNDQFMIGSYISCSVKRKLSRYGLPY